MQVSKSRGKSRGKSIKRTSTQTKHSQNDQSMVSSLHYSHLRRALPRGLGYRAHGSGAVRSQRHQRGLCRPPCRMPRREPHRQPPPRQTLARVLDGVSPWPSFAAGAAVAVVPVVAVCRAAPCAPQRAADAGAGGLALRGDCYTHCATGRTRGAGIRGICAAVGGFAAFCVGVVFPDELRAAREYCVAGRAARRGRVVAGNGGAWHGRAVGGGGARPRVWRAGVGGGGRGGGVGGVADAGDYFCGAARAAAVGRARASGVCEPVVAHDAGCGRGVFAG